MIHIFESLLRLELIRLRFRRSRPTEWSYNRSRVPGVQANPSNLDRPLYCNLWYHRARHGRRNTTNSGVQRFPSAVNSQGVNQIRVGLIIMKHITAFCWNSLAMQMRINLHNHYFVAHEYILICYYTFQVQCSFDLKFFGQWLRKTCYTQEIYLNRRKHYQVITHFR